MAKGIDLTTRILLHKYKTEGGGGPTPTGTLDITENGEYDVTSYASADVDIPVGSSINLFIQNDQPDGYDGIWIKDTDYINTNIVEVADENSLVASSINIVKGTTYETILFDSDVQNGVHYKFKEILFTDTNNDLVYDIPTYYGNGQSWVEITKKSIILLDYIESTGTQYIDMGIKGGSNYNIEADMQFTSFSGSTQAYFGVDYYRLQWSRDRLLHYYFGNSGNYSSYESGSNDRKLYAVERNIVKMNGTQILACNDNTFTTNTNLYLFAYNNSGTVRWQSKLRIYSFKIYTTEDVLLRDFVPAKDQNGVVCLYDNVSKQFFYNLGTGTFNYGSEI